MSSAWGAGPAQVYRCFSDEGECLYVGATIDLAARMVQHKQQTVWAWQVDRIETTDHASLRDARDHEGNEIKRLRPRWNIQGRGPRTEWKLADYVEVMFATAARRDNSNDAFYDPRDADSRIHRLQLEFTKRYPSVAQVVLEAVTPYLPTASPEAIELFERRQAKLRASAERHRELMREQRERVEKQEAASFATSISEEVV